MKGDLTKEIAEKLAKLKDLEMISNDHSNLISVEKPCARDPRSPVSLTLAVQNSLAH